MTISLRTLATATALALAPALAASPAIAGSMKAHHVAIPATVVDIAIASPAHTTLVTAVKAADLAAALSAAGPFTVFAPTNDAFAKLPAGTVDTLLKPENKAMLAKVLTYHVVAGRVTAAQLIALIKAGNGAATLTTLAGTPLTATIMDGKVMLTDAKGGMATVIATDLKAKNGVVHVTDAVSLPG